LQYITHFSLHLFDKIKNYKKLLTKLFKTYIIGAMSNFFGAFVS